MTDREIFETVQLHLLKQAAKSMQSLRQDKTRCSYRGDDGLRCAIGILIPDHLYIPNMEGRDILGSYSRHRAGRLVPTHTTLAVELGITSARIRSMLRELQRLHDGVDIRDWPKKLLHLEIKYFRAQTIYIRV